MQVSGLIHRDAYVGYDGTDRTIKVCFAAIAPVLLLLRLLIDGPVYLGHVSGMRFIYLHFHINLPNSRVELCRNCHFIAIQSVV